jgi:hypothetical protein
LVIRPREEAVEERHVEQPEGVDGIVESIGKVLVDVTIVVLLCNARVFSPNKSPNKSCVFSKLTRRAQLPFKP